MPVLPDFSPENRSYARSANAFISGQEAGQSMVERKQQMALRQQQDQRQQIELQAKLPLYQATAQSAIISAKSAIDAQTQNEKWKTQAAIDAGPFQTEFQNAVMDPDYTSRAEKLSVLQSKSYYMSQIPNSEYKGFTDIVSQNLVEAYKGVFGSERLQNALANTQLKNESAQSIAQVKFEAAQKAAEQTALHQKEMADTRAELQQSKLDQTGQTSYNKKRGEEMAAMVGDVQNRVTQHYSTIDQNARARALLDKDTEQGRGIQTVMGIQQAINSFVPNTFDTTNQEVLKQSYAEMALAAAAKMKGQGSITENERALLSESVAKFGNSPQAARYIMGFMDAVAKREIKRAEYFSELEDDGQMVTGKRNSDFYKQNPISTFIVSQTPKTSDTKVPLKVLGFVKQQ